MVRWLIVVVVLTFATPRRADATPAARQGIAELARHRVEAAAKVHATMLARFRNGMATIEDVYRWSLRWLDAASDGATGKALSDALAAHAERMRELQGIAADLTTAASIDRFEGDAVAYYCAEAAIWVARGKR
jgi:hypothetical protein